jgi:hypothetical protein
VAALLRERRGAEVNVEEGALGELSVWEGDRCLVRRNWLGFFPIEEPMARAVERALADQR